jgi:hypothetical protein
VVGEVVVGIHDLVESQAVGHEGVRVSASGREDSLVDAAKASRGCRKNFMSWEPRQEYFGEPDLKIAGFQRWIHRRTNPEVKSTALDPSEPALKIVLKPTDRLGPLEAQVEIAS